MRAKTFSNAHDFFTHLNSVDSAVPSKTERGDTMGVTDSAPIVVHEFPFNGSSSLISLIDVEISNALSAQIIFGLDDGGHFFPIAFALIAGPTAFPAVALRSVLEKQAEPRSWVARKQDGLYRVKIEGSNKNIWVMDPATSKFTHSVQETIPHLRAVFFSEVILKWINERSASTETAAWAGFLEKFLSLLSSRVDASLRQSSRAHSSWSDLPQIDTKGYEHEERVTRRIGFFAISILLAFLALGAHSVVKSIGELNPDYDRGIAAAAEQNHDEAVRYLQIAVDKNCDKTGPCMQLRLPLAMELRKLGRIDDERRVLEAVFRHGSAFDLARRKICMGGTLEYEEARLETLHAMRINKP